MYCVPVDFLSALNCAATFGSFVVDNIDREKIRQSRHRTPNGLLVLSNQASFSKIESDMINLFADACKERANGRASAALPPHRLTTVEIIA
jgi:hypothetical protein